MKSHPSLFFGLLLACAFSGFSSGQSAPLDTAALSAALDNDADWTYSGQPSEPVQLWGIKGAVEADYARRGPTVLQLTCYSSGDLPKVSRTITGPGIARVWTVPGTGGGQMTTRMWIAGGPEASITKSFAYKLYTLESWYLLELVVPEGTHTLHLETQRMVADWVVYNYGYFDDFSFVPNDFIFTVAPTAHANVGTSFALQATATSSIDPVTSPVTYSLADQPAWLTINPQTGLMEGTPTAAGTVTFSVSATNPITSHTKTVTVDVEPDLGRLIGEAMGQPGWEWRTSGNLEQSWVVYETAPSAWIGTRNQSPVGGAWVEATATGPGWVEWLQMDSAIGPIGQDWPASLMWVLVDGVTVGEAVWLPCSWWAQREVEANQRRVYIPRGTHTIRWVAGCGLRSDPRWFSITARAAIGSLRFTPGEALNIPPGSLSYASWALSLPEASREPDQDGDGDGITNWEEYAFGPQGATPVEFQIDADWATFRTRRFAEASDCRWELEFLYPKGWSGAFVWDHETTVLPDHLEFRLSTRDRLRTPPHAHFYGQTAVLENKPSNPLVRFKVTRR